MKVIISLLLCVIVYSAHSQDVLTPELLWKLKRVAGAKFSPNGKFIAYSVTTYDVSENKGNADLFIYDVDGASSRQLTNTPFSEFEFTWGLNNNLYYLSTEEKGLQIWRINASGSGKERISAFENIELEGFLIAPNEAYIATIEALPSDENQAKKYPDLPKANAVIADDLMYRHWDHWEDNKMRHVMIHPLKDGKVLNESTDILSGEKFHAILPPFGGSDQITISPDGKLILYTSKKLSGKDFALSTNSDIYAYNITSKKTENLSVGNEGYDVQPRFSPDGKKVAWLSMARDGFESDKNNITVMDFSARAKKVITGGTDLTVSDFHWSADGKHIYYKAAINGTIQLFSYSFESNGHKQLTDGWHDYVSLSVSDKYIVSGVQSMISPVDLHLYSIKNGKSAQITSANKEIMDKLKKPEIKQKWVTTTDNKKMLVWHILPPEYDENKKYPALLYCQGGPQSPVSQFFSYRWNFMLMASNGYVVIAPNRRGLPGFGQEWNDAISKDWGGQSIRDYLSATDDAAKESYVDADKMGAIGASYGGYSVYFLAGVHNKRFKTFISHAGLFNLESWYGTTEELFFANWDIGAPWDQPTPRAYTDFNPSNFTDKWNTPIMIIQGGLDFRVPYEQGNQAFQTARLKGLKSKFLYYPNENHWVLNPHNALVWQREYFKWLKETL